MKIFFSDSLPEFLPRLSLFVTLLLSLTSGLLGVNKMSMQRIGLQMRSLAASTVGEFKKEQRRLGPKSDFFFCVRYWMCGVSACENIQKRVSHGETVRVGSSVTVQSNLCPGDKLLSTALDSTSICYSNTNR